MSALTNHTIDTVSRNGYGRRVAVPVWISAVYVGQRVVLFPLCIMDEKKTIASALSTVIEMAEYRQLHWQEAAEMGSEVDAFALLPAIMEASPQERKNVADILHNDLKLVKNNEALFAAAPTLLEACEEGYASFHHCDCDDIGMQEVREEDSDAVCTFCVFRNAIAEAERK